MHFTQVSPTAELVTAPIKATLCRAIFSGCNSRVMGCMRSQFYQSATGIRSIWVNCFADCELLQQLIMQWEGRASFTEGAQGAAKWLWLWLPAPRHNHSSLQRPLACPVSRDKTESYGYKSHVWSASWFLSQPLRSVFTWGVVLRWLLEVHKAVQSYSLSAHLSFNADRAGWSTVFTVTPWCSCQQHFQKQKKFVKRTKVTWLLWETGMET